MLKRSSVKKLPISAFVVSKNEGHLLENCLESIRFCDEIVVVDLLSTDNTVEVSKRFEAKILQIETIAVVEQIHQRYIHTTKNDWVLITDPDEVTDVALSKTIIDMFETLTTSQNIGALNVPIIYYFKKHPLKGTSWGGVKYRTYLIHKDRFSFSADVHNGRKLKSNYSCREIRHDGKNHIHHYWMRGFRQLFEKHIRYLKKEGESRYNNGFKTSIFQILKIPFRQFISSFFYARGFKDGLLGLFLSIFRAWYFTAANIELYKFQKNKKND